MFSVSAKGIYGLVALVELASNYNKDHIRIKEIAKMHNIPQHYLEQLLIILKRAGFIKSIRGNQGGYAMAKSPHQIKISDVLQILEGDIKLIPLDKQNNMLQFFWESLEKVICNELDITLNDLLLKKQQFEKRIMYNI